MRAGSALVRPAKYAASSDSFFPLDGVPLFQDGAGIARLAFPEDVRVPPNQFVATSRATSSIVSALLRLRSRMKHHLQKQIAQFFAQIRVVFCPNCFRQFVRFLEQVWDERFVRLLAVPRAAAGCA